MQITIGFNEETLTAVTTLSSSLALLAASAKSKTSQVITNTVSLDAGTDEEKSETIYWADNSTGEFGKVESLADYKALKKKAPGTVKIPESKYDDMSAAAAKAEKSEKVEKKDTKKSAAKPQVEDSGEEATLEDVIAAFSAYLPKDLDKDERAERAAFVKPLLTRFGAAKATELPAEHRALAIHLVERKMAGEDVDPETDGFADDESLV